MGMKTNIRGVPGVKRLNLAAKMTLRWIYIASHKELSA